MHYMLEHVLTALQKNNGKAISDHLPRDLGEKYPEKVSIIARLVRGKHSQVVMLQDNCGRYQLNPIEVLMDGKPHIMREYLGTLDPHGNGGLEAAIAAYNYPVYSGERPSFLRGVITDAMVVPA